MLRNSLQLSCLAQIVVANSRTKWSHINKKQTHSFEGFQVSAPMGSQTSFWFNILWFSVLGTLKPTFAHGSSNLNPEFQPNPACKSRCAAYSKCCRPLSWVWYSATDWNQRRRYKSKRQHGTRQWISTRLFLSSWRKQTERFEIATSSKITLSWKIKVVDYILTMLCRT